MDTSPPASPPAWPAAALTKFRVPRLRRDTVERPALLARALELALERRVLLVQAPAGFGKTTLLAQLAGAFAARPGCRVAWVSLDADDSDPNRLFAALLGALQGLDLRWEVHPSALLPQLHDAGAASRAALVPLLNALSSLRGERALVVLDDLHRIADAAALKLLDHLIERLPPEVALCIGSRVEPPLSLARWRLHGELGELLFHDLRFGADEARGLLRQRGLEDLPDERLHSELARTGGWAAGLQLVLGTPGPAAAATAAVGPQAHRHLFDFFAQEVLAELPPDLREVVLRCAVLPELSPALCEAVTGRTDGRAVLDALYRRQLFLTALDESVPVLRFHDLFLDFLRSELDRRAPGLARELHARAAVAEPAPQRAVAHWLQAQRWDEALEAIVRCAEALLAAGGGGTVERWLEQLPEALRSARPEVPHLLGMCAWSRWDWPRARVRLEQACEAYHRAGRQAEAIEALGVLGACHNGMGELDAAARVLEEADRQELPLRQRVPFDSLHAWLALARGELDEAVGWLRTMARHVAREPSTIYPNVVDMAHGHFVGLPGAVPVLRELRSLCIEWRRHEATHWSSAVMAHGAWLAFWQGEREAAQAALAAQRRLQQHLPGALMLEMSSLHLHALHLALQGAHAEAVRQLQRVQALLEAPEAAGQRRSWGRSYLHALARLHWIAGDGEGLAALLPRLAAPRSPNEWPVLDTARALVTGQLALLGGDRAGAKAALLEAVALHRRWRLPSFIGDPRLSLAMCLLDEGDAAAARASLAPVLEEALRDDVVGPLLLEPPARLQRLLQACADDAPALRGLLQRLAAWHASPPPEAASETRAESGPWQGVTGREREVLALLAEGLSNKLIARRLELSPHTVKRHVANVLAKLGVESRGQAAAAWRRR